MKSKLIRSLSSSSLREDDFTGDRNAKTVRFTVEPEEPTDIITSGCNVGLFSKILCAAGSGGKVLPLNSDGYDDQQILSKSSDLEADDDEPMLHISRSYDVSDDVLLGSSAGMLARQRSGISRLTSSSSLSIGKKVANVSSGGKSASEKVAKADYLRRQRDFVEARQLYTEALSLYKKRKNENKNKIAEVQSKIQDCETSLNSAQNSVEIFQIGKQRLKRGEYERALRSLTVAHRVRATALGEDHPSVALILNQMGLLYCKQKQFDRAIDALDSASKIQVKSLSETDPERGHTLVNYGSVYDERGWYLEAISSYFEALEILRHNLADNSIVVENRKNITFAPMKREDGEGVEIFYGDSFNFEHQADSKVLEAIGHLLVKISQTYLKLQEVDVALLISSVALQVLQSAVGREDAKVASAMNNKATVLCTIGRLDEALKLCGEVLVMGSKSHSETHRTLYIIGSIEMEKHNGKKALKFFQESISNQYCLPFSERDNYSVSRTMMKMSEIFEDACIYDQAEQSLINALRTIKASFGNNHMETARMRHILGLYYVRRGKYDKAKSYYNDVTQIYDSKKVSEFHSYVKEFRRDKADLSALTASKQSSAFSSCTVMCMD